MRRWCKYYAINWADKKRLCDGTLAASSPVKIVPWPTFTILEKQKTLSNIPFLKVEGQDSCSGDSGGPLICEGHEGILGIVSYGYETCGFGPAVYTNLAPFYDWINLTMRSGSHDFQASSFLTILLSFLLLIQL